MYSSMLGACIRSHYAAKAIIGCLIIAFLILMGHSSTVLGQGLLGRPYLSAGYGMVQLKDPALRSAIGGWTDKFLLEGNIPVNENFDINLTLTKEWVEFDYYNGTQINYELDFTQVELNLVTHLAPDEIIDPYIEIGLGYASVLYDNPTFAIRESDNTTGVSWTIGFEWEINDQLALRPQISNSTSFDDFGAEDLLVDGAVFETQLIYWVGESIFTGISVGSDFDDVDVSLGFFVGIGSW